MARRRRSEPTTDEARRIALTIRQGERLGLTQREIGETLGINERTVRKIKSGQTSGKRTYSRVMHVPKAPRAETGLFNAEFVIGYTPSGEPVIGSTNVTIPNLRTATGDQRAATPLDVFRVRGLASVVAQERAALTRRYASVATAAPADSPVRLRAISRARKATTVIRTASML